MAYTPIEYIQSTGTQYIDTGYYPNNKTKVEISMKNNSTNDTYFLGGRYIWGTLSYGFYYESRYKFVYQEYAYSDITGAIDVIAILEPPTLNINGVTITGGNTSDYECTYTMFVFCMNNKGTSYKNASMNLYYMKIWDDGALVFDLIPVLDENNVACLYNKVTGTYLYNEGSGTFIAGDPIATIPTITIGTPSVTKISAISGHDQATVTFQSDVNLHNWEARATYQGQTIGHGSGLLVESGGSLAAYTNATVYVDDEELTNGDQEYTITVFGHGSDGYWSDGTYEAVNLLDLSTAVFWYHNATVSNDIVTYDTGTSNIESSKISIDLFLNGDYKGSALTARSVGDYSAILNKDSSFDTFALLLSGDSAYGSIEMNTSMMEDGERYIFSCTIDSFSLNQAVVSNISLVKAVI